MEKLYENFNIKSYMLDQTDHEESKEQCNFSQHQSFPFKAIYFYFH